MTVWNSLQERCSHKQTGEHTTYASPMNKSGDVHTLDEKSISITYLKTRTLKSQQQCSSLLHLMQKSQEDKARKNSGICEGKAQDSTTQTVKEPEVFLNKHLNNVNKDNSKTWINTNKEP